MRFDFREFKRSVPDLTGNSANQPIKQTERVGTSLAQHPERKICQVRISDSTEHFLTSHLRDFEEVLKALKWPFVSANFSLQTPSPTYVMRLQTLTEYLLQIELPNENPHPPVTSALLSDFPPVCLPINYLLVPLRKRFVYHFYGNRQTNRVDKPEWYVTNFWNIFNDLLF